MLRTGMLLAFALQACAARSPSSEPSSEPPGETAVEREPESATAPPGPSCPARFDAAMQGSTCESGGHCQWPEAECWCQAKQQCTGVDLGREAQTWLEWNCRVSDPSVLRADGCPAKVPEQGQPCGAEGQVCVYSPDCGGVQSTGRCASGAWQLEQLAVSAPPSAEG